MMMLVSEPECAETSNFSEREPKQIPAQYKGWRLTTKTMNGKLWLRWQHPDESFARYGCTIDPKDISSTIAHVRFSIDLAIQLEEEAAKQARRYQG
ncbi:hypothetical protein [Aerosakkonema funiforme]|uniref:hypothetical protein n=1 Tax=Aerosakkonema funiforme TaxID=1246630 RepID=UPI0035B7F8D3